MKYNHYTKALDAFNLDFDYIVNSYVGEHANDYDLEQLRDELYWASIDQVADGCWTYEPVSTDKLNSILSACDMTADPADEQPLSKELQNIRACYEDFCEYMDDCGMGELYRSMIGR